MRKTIVIMFCLLGMLLFSGCDESKVNPEDIPTIEEIEEVNETIEVNETVDTINETAEVGVTPVEIGEEIYTDEEINLCKKSSLENINLTEKEMSSYNYLTGLVKLEQTTKKPLIRNIDIDTYTNNTLEAFGTYIMECLNYYVIEIK